jgi:hypothetical protein
MLLCGAFRSCGAGRRGRRCCGCHGALRLVAGRSVLAPASPDITSGRSPLPAGLFRVRAEPGNLLGIASIEFWRCRLG